MSLSCADAPLAPLLAPLGDRLPRVFREQFLVTASERQTVRVHGVMDEVWFPPALSPLFRLLGRAGILVSRTGGGIPTVMEIIPGVDVSGQPVQKWNRSFDLGEGRTQRFDTVVVYDRTRGCPADIVGAGGFIYLTWTLTFTPPDLLVLMREACAIRLGGRTWWLPNWFWPLMLGRETFRQWADLTQPDAIRIELVVNHPLLGRVFRYCGSFRVERVPAAPEGGS